MHGKLLSGKTAWIFAVILTIFMSVGVAEEQMDGGGQRGHEAEKADTLYSERIRPAIDALTLHWREMYADAISAAPERAADGYLEIKNTRIIFWKENVTAEYLPDYYTNVTYAVEFMLLSNYFGSSPHYFNHGIYDCVVFLKDGSADVPINSIFDRYRAQTFSSDFTSFIDSIVDLGDAYNETFMLK
jgi:hypothetical protein